MRVRQRSGDLFNPEPVTLPLSNRFKSVLPGINCIRLVCPVSSGDICSYRPIAVSVMPGRALALRTFLLTQVVRTVKASTEVPLVS
jgi:hypothetical protein